MADRSTVDTEAAFAATERYRRSFADLLETLNGTQLATPSLCAGWDVRTVAGHLASAASSPSMIGVLVSLVRAGGSLDRMVDRASRAAAARPVPELVAMLREHAGNRIAPPVVGPRGPMTDVLVHTADVTIPLAVPYDPDPADVAAALDFVTGGRAPGFVPRGRLDGLRLVAADAGFDGGQGERIAGRGIDVLVAACGRPAALERVSGPGVAVLRARLTG